MVARSGEQKVGEISKDGQKVQISICKIHKYWDWNVVSLVNDTVFVHLKATKWLGLKIKGSYHKIKNL